MKITEISYKFFCLLGAGKNPNCFRTVHEKPWLHTHYFYAGDVSQAICIEKLTDPSDYHKNRKDF